jgi:hypothetical protein
MPTIQSDWQGQLNSLRNANIAAERRVSDFTKLLSKNQATQSQLDQAKLGQLHAAQKYNSFIESGRQLIKIGTDAEARLKSSNLT